MHIVIHRGAQIQGTWSPGRINLVQSHLRFVGPRYGTCFTSLFWCLELWGSSWIFFGKSVHPWSYEYKISNGHRCLVPAEENIHLTYSKKFKGKNQTKQLLYQWPLSRRTVRSRSGLWQRAHSRRRRRTGSCRGHELYGKSNRNHRTAACSSTGHRDGPAVSSLFQGPAERQ